MKVYEYYCKPPDRRDEALSTLRSANDYYNELVEIERDRWAQRDEIMEPIIGASVQAEQRLAEQVRAKRDEIAADRSARRSRKSDPTIQSQLRDMERDLRQARATLRDERKRARAELSDELAACDDQAKARSKAARASCGVYWGTYLLREEDFGRACKDARNATKCAKAHKPIGPPRFRRYDGQGALGVQLQCGLSVSDLLGAKDSRLRLIPTGPKFALLEMRTGSQGRDPIWTTVSVLMHRPLPPGGVVKWCKLQRTLTADRERWKVQFVVAEPEHVPERIDDTEAGLDVGWRLRPDGSLRVAHITDASGRREEIVLPGRIASKFRHADSIRAIRDREFNLALEVLAKALPRLPDDLAAMAGYSSRWRGNHRLVAFLRRWESESPFRASDVLTQLQQWRDQDRHLWLWEAHERKKADRQRREVYRLAADRICSRYARLRLEGLDLSELAARPKEADVTLHAEARRNRVIACVSAFRSALEMMAAKHGTTIERVEAAYTTRTCSACGYVNRWKDQAPLELQCGGCGSAWDQDVNASEIILASGPVTTLPPGSARNHLSPARGRWARRGDGDDGSVAVG